MLYYATLYYTMISLNFEVASTFLEKILDRCFNPLKMKRISFM
jgi:hypothetical protein